MDDTHFGFYIDAVDSQKFGIPTTASQAKCLAKMQRIKQKLTGVQLFRDDSLLLFRTLPDVKTGGNLTLTILGHMLQNFVRDTNVADLYINFDGASDNICYTVLYGIAHYLRCARANGWALRRVHCLRFVVGHTHNILDSTFGVLSRHVYGKHGTTPRDLLSFSGFNAVCKEVFGEQLRRIVDIRAVHDFNTFLSGYRRKADDRHIRKQYAFTFEVREGNTVFVRSKARCAAETPWGPWFQMLPNIDLGEASVHPPDAVPPMAAPKPWPKWCTTVVPSLNKFYNRTFQHPVSIPPAELLEMRK